MARTYSVNETFFDRLDSPDKVYWLGFIMADGWIGGPWSFGMNLKSSDEGHLIKFADAIESNHKIKHIDVILNGNTYYQSKFVVHSSKMVKRLMELGIVKNKSLFGKPYDGIPEEYLRDYWRGMVDGDGSVMAANTGGSVRWRVFLCGTKDIVYGFSDFINRYVGGTSALPFKKSHQRHYNVMYSGNKLVKDIVNLLYKDAVVYLDRKYEFYKKIVASPIASNLLADFSLKDFDSLHAKYGRWIDVAKFLNIHVCTIERARWRLQYGSSRRICKT